MAEDEPEVAVWSICCDLQLAAGCVSDFVGFFASGHVGDKTI